VRPLAPGNFNTLRAIIADTRVSYQPIDDRILPAGTRSLCMLFSGSVWAEETLQRANSNPSAWDCKRQSGDNCAKCGCENVALASYRATVVRFGGARALPVRRHLRASVRYPSASTPQERDRRCTWRFLFRLVWTETPVVIVIRKRG